MFSFFRAKRVRKIVVYAILDEEADVWVATSDDVPGLATEADTLDLLARKLSIMVPELLELNGVIGNHDALPRVPFDLLTQFDGSIAPDGKLHA